MAIRIGVQLQPQHTTFDQFARACQRCEELGVDTVWTWDHFYPLYGDPEGAHFEGFTLLTAAAMLTKRVEVGHLVLCNSYRNPNLVADMARTLDHCSGGRFILGLGSGWFEKDYQRYSYEFGTAPGRLKQLRTNLPIILDRLEKLNPPPLRKLPLMIGGGGEKVTLKITAQYADQWNGFGPPENFAHKNRVLDKWCQEMGRPPEAIERTVLLTSPGDSEKLDAFVEAGANHVIVGVDGAYPLDKVEKVLAWRDKVKAGRP